MIGDSYAKLGWVHTIDNNGDVVAFNCIIYVTEQIEHYFHLSMFAVLV